MDNSGGIANLYSNIKSKKLIATAFKTYEFSTISSKIARFTASPIEIVPAVA